MNAIWPRMDVGAGLLPGLDLPGAQINPDLEYEFDHDLVQTLEVHPMIAWMYGFRRPPQVA